MNKVVLTNIWFEKHPPMWLRPGNIVAFAMASNILFHVNVSIVFLPLLSMLSILNFIKVTILSSIGGFLWF